MDKVSLESVPQKYHMPLKWLGRHPKNLKFTLIVLILRRENIVHRAKYMWVTFYSAQRR